MASFSGLGSIAADAVFQQRVQHAMSVAALAIYAEDAGTSGHAARAAFAVRVLAGNFSLPPACVAVLANASIAAEANPATTPDFAIPDSDIQFTVNSIWNALAGA